MPVYGQELYPEVVYVYKRTGDERGGPNKVTTIEVEC